MKRGEFVVVPGRTVGEILTDNREQVLAVVREVYDQHHRRQTVNPDSYFLRFPGRTADRVIALPGYLAGRTNLIGIKWIGSFPDNLRRGLPRASAVLVLNDPDTGYPLALLEAAGISAARTAASAALAVASLPHTATNCRIAFVGAGLIARTIADYLPLCGLDVAEAYCHDPDQVRARRLLNHLAHVLAPAATRRVELQEALTADIVVFATTSGAPYVEPGTRLRPGQLVLHISLRDLRPELLLAANNVVDDVDHCLKAQTSAHLAEQLTGSRAFVTGTLAAIRAGEAEIDPRRPVIFSPFGLGVLDIGVGGLVLNEALHRGEAINIPDFFDTVGW